MIDPIQIKQEVAKGKLKFWIDGERLYCSDTDPSTITVLMPYSVALIEVKKSTDAKISKLETCQNCQGEGMMYSIDGTWDSCLCFECSGTGKVKSQ